MKRIIFSVVFVVLFRTIAFADQEVIVFSVIQKYKLQEIISDQIAPTQSDLMKISDHAIARGHITGNSNMFLWIKEYQYKIQTTNSGNILKFSLKMISNEKMETVFSSSGRVILSNEYMTPTIRDNWQNEDYVIVWHKENMLQ